MLIGCPKEIKPQEFRTGLTPRAAAEAIAHGHQVIVETGTGLGAGFPDADYRAVGAEVVETAKEVFDRPRPDLVPHGAIVSTASFPSGHSMMAAVTYLTLGVLIARGLSDRRLKIYVLSLAVTMTLLVGVSRVYLGVHWPTDVLAGWLAGSGWAVACLLGASLVSRNRP